MTLPASLCTTCRHVRKIVSGKGSSFLLCRLSRADARFPKYPPQPVVRCQGYDESGAGEQVDRNESRNE